MLRPYQVSIWSPRHDFCYCRTFAGLLIWGAFSDERRVCRLQFLLVLASAVIFGSESNGNHDHILLSQLPDSSNLEGQVPVFISPRNRVTQLNSRYWVPFSSFPTIHSATVEIIKPASTFVSDSNYIASERPQQKTAKF
jgi:hypothetical protein